MENSKLMNIITFIVLFFIIGAAYSNIFMYNLTQKIPIIDVNSPLIVPFLLNTILTVMVLFILKNEIAEWKRSRSDDTQENEMLREFKSVLLFFLGLLAYICVVKVLHFEVATFLAMGLGMFFLSKSEVNGKAPIVKIALVSLILVVSIRAVFTGVFKIVLP